MPLHLLRNVDGEQLAALVNVFGEQDFEADGSVIRRPGKSCSRAWKIVENKIKHAKIKRESGENRLKTMRQAVATGLEGP